MPNEKENEMERPKYDTYESAYVEDLKRKLKAAHEVVSLAVEFTSHSLYGRPAIKLAKAIDAYNDLEPHPSTINDPQLPTSVTSGGCPAIVKDALNSKEKVCPHISTSREGTSYCELAQRSSLSPEAVEKIRQALKAHHQWHRDQDDLVVFKQANGEDVEINLASEYADSSLCDQTIEALALLPHADTGKGKE